VLKMLKMLKIKKKEYKVLDIKEEGFIIEIMETFPLVWVYKRMVFSGLLRDAGKARGVKSSYLKQEISDGMFG